MAVFGCIADDFTGASDAASFLVKGGLPTQLFNGIPTMPLPPDSPAQALVIAPATGTTMALLAAGISSTTVALAAKSLLRNGRPIVVAPSTNDGLAGSAQALAALLQRKHYYFVPFGQDDSYKKPTSLKSDFTLLPDALESALRGAQLQPLLL